MSVECYPMTVLPHVTRLYRDYLGMGELAGSAAVRGWYGAEPASGEWMGRAVGGVDAEGLADALRAQGEGLGAGTAALANVEKLRGGARAVVTGQQVGLFGGPLLTLLKAATAIARAKEATAATGEAHVPVFWLATEDHDLAEVDQVSLLSKQAVETLRMGDVPFPGMAMPAGKVVFQGHVDGLLEQASELLGYAPVCDLLRECYGYEAGNGDRPTYGSAFGKLMTRLFAAEGLIVMDASERVFHRLGASTLRYAIEHAEELETALLERSDALEAAGYHTQVLVKKGMSTLFLISAVAGMEGAWDRQVLRRTDAGWKAGSKTYSTAALLEILEEAPERLSPNALLRPVFQDTILPTAAYVGGPAEVAYFAQSAALYERILGRVTAVLPRLSATLIEPSVGEVMERHEMSLEDVFAAKTVEGLTQRLGARAMPIESKRRLAAVGNAMDTELTALTEYLEGMEASLGRSAMVSANKMRYQMNRLRRMAATFEVQKEASLRKHAEAIMLHLFPEGHPQERVIGGVWFLAEGGEGLIQRLVTEAGEMCLGHTVLRV